MRHTLNRAGQLTPLSLQVVVDSRIPAMRRAARLTLISIAAAVTLSGCGVISLAGSVAGAVVDVGAAVVTTGVKVTGAAIGAVIPDSKSETAPAQPASAPQ